MTDDEVTKQTEAKLRRTWLAAQVLPGLLVTTEPGDVIPQAVLDEADPDGFIRQRVRRAALTRAHVAKIAFLYADAMILAAEGNAEAHVDQVLGDYDRRQQERRDREGDAKP